MYIPAGRNPDATGLGQDSHIWFLGNSHASQLTGMISLIREMSAHPQTILYTGAIKNPPIPKPLMLAPWDRDPWTANGIKTQQAVGRYVLNSARPGDVIVLGNDLFTFASHPGDINQRRQAGLKAWIESLSIFLSQAAARRINVVVWMPTPFFEAPRVGFSTSACRKNWFRSTAPMDCFLSAQRKQLVSTTAEIASSLKMLQGSHRNLYLFSGFDILCPPSRSYCTNHISDGFTYRDETHLNNRGSALMAPSFLDLLASLRRPDPR